MAENREDRGDAIDLDEMDPSFRDQIEKEHGGERVKRCFACGTCSVSCPVFAVEPSYDPRKIIRMITLGMKKEVLESKLIWLCSGCYNCYELCPRDVKITSLMAALRNIAVEEGHIPDAMRASIDQLDKYGRLLEVSDFENTVRDKKGIPILKLDIPEISRLLEVVDIRKKIRGGAKDE